MIRSEKAVSEVVGMVMILSIMVIVIGAIMLVGVPMIDSGKERARMDVAANSFLSMQNDIEEVVRGPIWVRDPNITTGNTSYLQPSRETEFELMGGTISVFPNTNGIIYQPANNTVVIYPGNISYTSGQESIIYENGAVIRKYEGGDPLMVSDPLIKIYDTGDGNITVSIHAISINGTLSSTGGDGKALVETWLVNYSVITPTKPLKQTNISIFSKYPEAWRAFFDQKLQGVGLSSPTGYNISNSVTPLEVQIYGKNASTNDILLSVYESKIIVKVR